MTSTTETEAASPEPAPAAEPAAADAKTSTGLPAVRDEADVDAAMEAWRNAEPAEREALLPAGDAWARMEGMARRLARSPLLPAHIRQGNDPEANMMVILLTAHDLGLSATVAMQKVNVIEGKPAMSAELMRMLVRRDGHDIWSDTERDADGRAVAVTWFGVRKDQPERVHEARFSINDAADAGLCSIENGRVKARSGTGKKLPWETYTEDMLSARATSRLCRRVFEDCLAGVSYTPEELGVIEADVIEPPASSTEEERAAILAEIERLRPEVQAEVRRRWKEAKLGTLRPARHEAFLRASEVDAAWILLKAADEETPEEAEIVEGGAAGGPSPDGSGGHPVGDSVQGEGVSSLTPDNSDAASTPEPPDGPGATTTEPSDATAGDTPPAPAVADPVAAAAAFLDARGHAVPSYAGRPTETVELPPCEDDVAEQEVDGPPKAPPAAGQAAGNPSGTGAPVRTAKQIQADVRAMTVDMVRLALTNAGLPSLGAPATIRKRLVEHIKSLPF